MKSSPYGPLVRTLIRLFMAGGPLRWLFGVALLGVIGLSLWRPDLLSDSRSRSSVESSDQATQRPQNERLPDPRNEADERSVTDRSQDGSSHAVPENDSASDNRSSSSRPDRETRPGESAGATSQVELTRLPDGVLRSPAGLLYTRGGAEGHRLDHVMAHGVDQRGRPGNHGVFAHADRNWIVQVIDDAYALAIRGTRTRRRQEDGRTIYTVDMEREIGYIGGDMGNRDGRPSARHIRLVLEDRRVITAYPIIP